jgi:hypothetical protein
MEKGCLALKQRESIHFGDFWHIKMILQKKMLQTSFPKLKKHTPTRLYMLYPRVQSVALACVEIDKKKALQGHSPLSSSHHPSSIVQKQKQNHFGAQARSYQIGMRLGRSPRAQISCHINN